MKQLNYYEQITKQLAGSDDLDGRYKRSHLYWAIKNNLHSYTTNDLVRRHRRYTKNVAAAADDEKAIQQLINDFNAIVRSTKQPPVRMPGSPRN